jgi:histidinol phosphatase-like enzyme
MISKIMSQHHFSKEHSFMVGDKIIDAEAGKNAGIQGVIVRGAESKEFPYFKTLLDFALSLK